MSAYPRLLCLTTGMGLLLSGCEMGNIEDGFDQANPDKADTGSTIRIGNFPGPDGPIRAPYLLKGDVAMVGGDIMWPANSALSIQAAAGPFSRWPGGIIPYVNSGNNADFVQGVNAWNSVSQETGITLVPRTDQQDYIEVVAGDVCSSYLGLKGGAQELTLAAACDGAAAIHEIGHAIGLMHEHARADRDSYIRFNWDNVVGGEAGDIAQVNLGITQGATNYSGYDFASIMHYTNTVTDPDFVIDPSVPLYELVGSGPAKVDNYQLSAGDISGVAAMYQGYGGQDPDGSDPGGSTCAVAACADYGMSEGECQVLSTGNYVCEDSCLKKTLLCAAGDPDPNPDDGTTPTGDTYACDSGQEIPASYYCDAIVDCYDNSDEVGCGSTDTGGTSTDWGACSVGASGGLCVDTGTTTCFGELYSGYCPGPNGIRCCI